MGMRYIAYEIRNVQPVFIANLDLSKPGETETLSYLPGSTLRGMVIAKLKEEMADEDKKQKILTKARFYNGYPMAGEKELLPSPKGFHENKRQDGELKNNVADPLAEIGGYKRASIGKFCVWDRDTLQYMSPEQEDALNICVKDKNIFRKSVLSAGQHFRAYIAVDGEEEELAGWLKRALQDKTGYVGANRTSGYGKCRITLIGEEPPYQQVACAKGGKEEVYLYLASNLSMRNAFGEICGIDLKRLADLLGVEKLEQIAAATSVCKMSGVNRTWGCRTPEVVMYEAGSVFRLKDSSKVAIVAMERVRQNGLGEKREEGCGQILFLENYDKIRKKEALPYAPEEADTQTALTEQQIAQQLTYTAKEIVKSRIKQAMEYYVAEQGVDRRIKKSQLGILLNHAKYARVVGLGSAGRIEH